MGALHSLRLNKIRSETMLRASQNKNVFRPAADLFVCEKLEQIHRTYFAYQKVYADDNGTSTENRWWRRRSEDDSLWDFAKPRRREHGLVQNAHSLSATPCICLCLFANQGNTTCQTYRDRQKQTVRQTNRQTERHTDNMTNLTKREEKNKQTH